MDKVINNYNGFLSITDNDEYLASVISDLATNNTAFPDIVDLYEFQKNSKVLEKNDKGEMVKKTVKKTALRVYFDDGTWTDVVKSDEDKNDPVTAILYAVAKRLFGSLTEGGYVKGDGFMNYLKGLTKHIRTDESDEEKRKARIKEKEDADKKAHEEAVKRKEKNPSLGLRVSGLEKMFNTLCEKIDKIVSK